MLPYKRRRVLDADYGRVWAPALCNASIDAVQPSRRRARQLTTVSRAGVQREHKSTEFVGTLRLDAVPCKFVLALAT